MTDKYIPTLVLGEAPESDDEDTYFQDIIPNVEGRASVVAGREIIGEAEESDDEVELHNTHSRHTDNSANVRTVNVKDIINKINPNSLKKLKEQNEELYDSLTSFRKQILNSTNYELNNINQQSLKVQVELQQTLMNIRSVKCSLYKYQKKLKDIVLADYIPAINIKVPAHII